VFTQHDLFAILLDQYTFSFLFGWTTARTFMPLTSSYTIFIESKDTQQVGYWNSTCSYSLY
jgi:hypothetical protein